MPREFERSGSSGAIPAAHLRCGFHGCLFDCLHDMPLVLLHVPCASMQQSGGIAFVACITGLCSIACSAEQAVVVLQVMMSRAWMFAALVVCTGRVLQMYISIEHHLDKRG